MTTKQEKAEAIAQLREWLKPGDTVHTILRNVSRSGMSREIGVVILRPDGVTLHPNWSVAKALGLRQGKRDGVIVGGCGMDMGFHLVSNLAYILYPNGFGCVGEKCRSADHANGDRDRTPHTAGDPLYVKRDERNRPAFTFAPSTGHVHWHASGDYALRHEWL